MNESIKSFRQFSDIKAVIYLEFWLRQMKSEQVSVTLYAESWLRLRAGLLVSGFKPNQTRREAIASLTCHDLRG